MYLYSYYSFFKIYVLEQNQADFFLGKAFLFRKNKVSILKIYWTIDFTKHFGRIMIKLGIL